MRLPRTILHVLHSASGGAPMSTVALISRLKEHDVDSVAVCNDDGTPHERAALLNATDGRVVFGPLYPWHKKKRSKLWKRPGIQALHLWRTRAIQGSTRKVMTAARQWNADLIHSSSLLAPEGGLASRALPLPHVWHCRERVGPGLTFEFTLPIGMHERLMANLSTLVVANSHVSAHPFNHLRSTGRLVVVPNGVDLAPFLRNNAKRKNTTLVVGMIANVTSQWKRHRLFIEAAARLPKDINAEFRVYGHDPTLEGSSDPYAQELHDLVSELDLKERFRWMGYSSDMHALMGEIDILVHPTELESFGRIAVEAMASAIPVIGVQGGGIGEIVLHERTGLLGAIGSASEMAQGIEKLARAPELRRQMGIAGRERAEKEYSLETHADRMLRAYDRALALHNSGL